jgi:hypothetical protein
MKGIINTKPFPALNNIHVSSETVILDFLNTNSKAFGALKYMGTFIDNVKIKHEIGIKEIFNF